MLTAEWMKESKSIAIYGAGMVAVSIYYALKELCKSRKVIRFIVSRREENPAEIDGIPVVELDRFDQIDAEILVAVPENFHSAIVAELERRDLKNYICIDSRTEAAVMEEYYKRVKQFPVLRSFEIGEKVPSLKVYMAKFFKDKPLKNPYQMAEWIYPIQAGAALTETYVAKTKDNLGENISAKNGNYSELTAMYWIGKHGKADYLGLFHYRRVLDITEEDLYRLLNNDIDAILPFPTIHTPSSYEHHKRYLKDHDWEAMTLALKELVPNYWEVLPTVFSQPYFYNYNMLIAKRHILKDFCDWLFPILKRTEELSIPRGWERTDRYIGYLGESLTTLYFMYHKDNLKIAHTGRLMLI